ncbi:MAG: M23 family metallopeptidase [Pseudobdellovibrio sp.]|nr:M23 family metallopeptidase [Pseudobdellovibrio sp.]
MQKFSNLLILPLLLTTLLFESGCVSHQTAPSTNHENGDEVKVEIDKGTNSFKKSRPSRMKEKPFFDWPVVEARMSRGFLPKVTRKRKRPHKGIDLAAQRGTAVMASHDGMVIYTGKEFKGYGKMLMIEKDGWATLYGHLDKIIVYEGQKVKQGDVVGALGNTGRSSGPHLHFEIRKADGPIDPLPYLPAGEALTNDVDNGAEEY